MLGLESAGSEGQELACSHELEQELGPASAQESDLEPGLVVAGPPIEPEEHPRSWSQFGHSLQGCCKLGRPHCAEAVAARAKTAGDFMAER